MNPQLEGVEAIKGTYPFDIATSVRAYRLNKYLNAMKIPEHRDLFNRDPEASFERAGLSEEERAMIRKRDWIGLIRYGAIFFVLEKLVRQDKVANAEVYAAMRGETLDQFLATRNVPGVR
jgi:gallate dioxygenase